METNKSMLASAPDDHLDSSLQGMISTFHDEITAEEALRLLDKACFCGGASTLGMMLMEHILQEALTREGRTYAEVVQVADSTWRLEGRE